MSTSAQLIKKSLAFKWCTATDVNCGIHHRKAAKDALQGNCVLCIYATFYAFLYLFQAVTQIILSLNKRQIDKPVHLTMREPDFKENATMVCTIIKLLWEEIVSEFDRSLLALIDLASKSDKKLF